MRRIKKVGILGGTFNPPHNGHIKMAQTVMEALKLDEVRFMPNAIAPHKHVQEDVSADMRLRMVELICWPYERFFPFNYEIRKGGLSYTYDTMKDLSESEHFTHFYFIIGGDMIDTLETWHEIDALSELVTFVGVMRPGTKGLSKYPVEIVEMEPMDISSTMIREKVARGESISHLVPLAIAQIIREEGLYDV